jgi:hypothetical protein
MGSIGPLELLIIAVILLVLLAGLVAGIVAIVLVSRSRRATHDLVECRACRRRISPRATACPHCGDPV